MTSALLLLRRGGGGVPERVDSARVGVGLKGKLMARVLTEG